MAAPILMATEGGPAPISNEDSGQDDVGSTDLTARELAGKGSGGMVSSYQEDSESTQRWPEEWTFPEPSPHGACCSPRKGPDLPGAPSLMPSFCLFPGCLFRHYWL